MPDIVIVVHIDHLTIDGELPEGYRLVVHNHTGEPDLFPYERESSDCHYPDSARDQSGSPEYCFEYREPYGRSRED